MQRSKETEFQLKDFIINSRLFLVLGIPILLVVFPIYSKSQNDTISASFQIHFEKNLTELNNLYCWSDSTFYRGKFQFNPVGNIQKELRNLNLPFFSVLNNQTEAFYQFIAGLENEEKMILIRYFSFYENEIEEALKLKDLPVQLKYLAPALSGMNPIATSLDGKTGVWQLTHFQAILNGATVNKLVDERFSVSISTNLAAQQIKQNLQQFETVDLAVVAFLFGNVKVRNAVQLAERSGQEFADFLPNSLNEFIAAFQAMAVFLNANTYKVLDNKFVEKDKPDTVNVSRELHLKQVADVLGIQLKRLQFLNPEFKFQIIPGNNKLAQLILPNGKLDDFVIFQDSIYNSYDSTLFQFITQKIEYPPSPNRQYVREPVKDLEIEGKTKIQYRLKTGDVLGIIAEDYDVRVTDLKYWNNIYNERKIQAGKKLDIFVDDDKVDYYLSLAAPQKSQKKSFSVTDLFQKNSSLKVFEDLSSAKKIEHIVKNGESPYLIAKKYKDVTPDEILEWNNIDNARKIQIGQKLIVYLK